MPGKTSQASNRGGKQESRLYSAPTSEGGVKKISIWPEWIEAELATEKWDIGVLNTGGGKSRIEKSKASHFPTVYDDPDGVFLPPSLTESGTVVWKRPVNDSIAGALGNSSPVIVDDPNSSSLDLYSSNKQLLHSQLMCWIIGQINSLWAMRHTLSVYTGGFTEGEKDGSLTTWRPWEHIYPSIKSTSVPQMNLMGKYCVRIYWMGCWRKVTVDDKLPFIRKVSLSRSSETDPTGDGESESVEEEVSFIPLYLRTALLTELWPAIITKAIIKVVALDYCWDNTGEEFGDSSVIHMLTGWTPNTIHIKSYPTSEIWNILSDLLPHWVRKKEDGENGVEGSHAKEDGTVNAQVEEKGNVKPQNLDCIVIGNFDSCFPSCTIKPLTIAATEEVSQSEDLLKKFQVIPLSYNLSTMPSYPVLLTQIRDEPLNLPPKSPPLPVLQAPYYLGLKNRKQHPGHPTPPPTPPPVEPRFVELLPIIPPDSATESVAPNTSTATTTKSLSSEKTDKKSETLENRNSDRLSKKSGSSSNKTTTSFLVAEPSDQQLASEVLEEARPIWMDYAEFFSAFKSLHIFKNMCCYKCRDTYANLSKIAGESPIAFSSKKGVSISHLNSLSNLSAPKEQQYLLTDNVDAIDLSFVFSCLCNWREGRRDTHRYNDTTPNVACGDEEPSSRLTTQPTSPNNLSQTPDYSVVDQGGDAICERISKSEESLLEGECQRRRKSVQPGSLVVEKYSWKTVEFGDPVLRISTTGTKGAVLSLPPGRHVFKLHVKVPIGHHLEIFSQSNFVLANRDSMFSYMVQDSSRFLSISSSIVKTILCSCNQQKLLEENVQPPVELSEEQNSLEESLQPLAELSEEQKSLAELLSECHLTSGHVKLLLSSALCSWSTHAEECGLDLNSKIAWKALLYKAFSILEDKLPSGTCSTSDNVSALRNHLKMKKKKTKIPEMWVDRQSTAEEETASRVISHHFRLYTEALLKDRMTPGNSAYEITSKLLEESLPTLEPHCQKLGSTMLHGVFQLDPSLAEGFPFSEDSAYQAYSTQYSGIFPQIQTNSWTIAIRKTMRIPEPQLIAFHFHCPLQSSLLRVINNDTMTEMPRVFQSTIPQVYQPNEKGYTLQVEAWIAGAILPDEGDSKKWKLRVVTSNRHQPPLLEGCSADEKKPTEELFHKQERLTYCLPDREDIVLRYCLITSYECQVSIHLTASKQDALINLEILDREESLVATEGRGTCIIPLWTLHPTQLHSEDTASDSSQQGEKVYVVQARVLRKSWPVSETAWPFIGTIFRPEERIIKPSSGKKSRGKDKKKATTTTTTTTTSTPAPVNVPPQKIDTDKPHLLLRIITKATEDRLEVKKDTEKEDKLKSMIQAWETQEPGRSKKALKSRQKFLDARAIREETQDEQVGSVSEVGGPQTPQPNPGPTKIWKMDLTPFIIKEGDETKLLDEAEQACRLAERQQLFKEYRSHRQAVLQLRNENREQRNEAKLKQLEIAEQWQIDLDVCRNKLNQFHEATRGRTHTKDEIETLKRQEEASSNGGRRDSKSSKGKGEKKK